MVLVYNHKIFTKLPSYEVLHGTTMPKGNKPVFPSILHKSPLWKMTTIVY